MNVIWPRFLKNAYRKEPISSFVLVAGGVDVVIGGLGGYGTLACLGLVAVGGAVTLRWWQLQRTPKSIQPEQVAQSYLPSQASRPELPMLSIAKKRPPH
uniref:Uncharacterized protein n=1 Tax=Cyanothece sp. (strain PCC 7425 / ATCC 29141) TaxID=395961 RepID=B8HJW2_CYAP4